MYFILLRLHSIQYLSADKSSVNLLSQSFCCFVEELQSCFAQLDNRLLSNDGKLWSNLVPILTLHGLISFPLDVINEWSSVTITEPE